MDLHVGLGADLKTSTKRERCPYLAYVLQLLELYLLEEVNLSLLLFPIEEQWQRV